MTRPFEVQNTPSFFKFDISIPIFVSLGYFEGSNEASLDGAGVRRYLEGWLARREPSLISCCGETYYLEMGNESGDRASRAMGLALVDCETR